MLVPPRAPAPEEEVQEEEEAEAEEEGGGEEEEAGASPHVWMLVGLGSRGLLYHAWLGRMLAECVMDGREERLPVELRAWKERGG